MNRRECVLLGVFVVYTAAAGAALLWLIGT
jgi:hypothetical protein